MPLPQPSLKSLALRLLSRREYSRAELVGKLKAVEKEPGQLERTLDELKAKGLINEQRVVDSVVHRRSGKLGVARIRQELQRKGLDVAVVQDAVASLQSTELERARAVWRKKFAARLPVADSIEVASPAESRRQMRFLASRGFSTDTIRRVVAAASDDLDQIDD